MGVFDDLAGVQVAAVASVAGFAADKLVTAVAIAKGESSWDSSRVNSSAGETPPSQRGKTPCASVGLWQINVCPDRDGKDPNRGNGNGQPLLDPLTNARAAFAISSAGSNFSAWTVYREGKHTKHLEAARKAVAQLGTDAGAKTLEQARSGAITSIGGGGGGGIGIGDLPGIGAALPGVIWDSTGGAVWNTIDGWKDAIAAIVRFIVDPKSWLRLLAAWAGASLVVVGLVLLGLDLTGLTDNAAGAAIGGATAGPAGAALGATGA
jgi:hypothetical protein